MLEPAEVEVKQPKNPGGVLNVFAICTIVGGFATQIIRLMGQRGYSFVLPDLKAALDVSTAEIGLVASMYGTMSALGAIVWGGISDKIGPRLTLTASGLCFAVGCFLMGMFATTGLIAACACWTIAGFGASGLYMATIPKLISAWFVPERRGSAMRWITPGGAATGMLLGVIMPILIPSVGMTGCFYFFGTVAAVLTAFFFVMIRDDPYQKDLVPVGSPAGTQLAPFIPEDKKAQKGAYIRACKLPIVWRLSFMYVFYQFFWQANSTYYVANMRGVIGLEAGGFGVTLCSVSGMIAMLLIGWASDKIGRKNTTIIGYIGAIAFALALYFLCTSGIEVQVPIMYVLVIGLNICLCLAPVMLAMFADYFPEDINSTYNGIVSTVSALGYFTAPVIAGACIDALGSTAGFYPVVAVGAALTLIMTFFLPKTAAEQAKAEAKKAA